MDDEIIIERVGQMIGPIPDQIGRLVREMERNEWSDLDAAILITRDRETGMLTFVHMTETGIDEDKLLFNAAATALGYALKRVN